MNNTTLNWVRHVIVEREDEIMSPWIDNNTLVSAMTRRICGHRCNMRANNQPSCSGAKLWHDSLCVHTVWYYVHNSVWDKRRGEKWGYLDEKWRIRRARNGIALRVEEEGTNKETLCSPFCSQILSWLSTPWPWWQIRISSTSLAVSRLDRLRCHYRGIERNAYKLGEEQGRGALLLLSVLWDWATIIHILLFCATSHKILDKCVLHLSQTHQIGLIVKHLSSVILFCRCVSILHKRRILSSEWIKVTPSHEHVNKWLYCIMFKNCDTSIILLQQIHPISYS